MATESDTVACRKAAEAAYRQVRHGSLPPMPLRPQDEAMLAKCETFSFGDALARRAWAVGEGRTVLLVHGWGGLGVQMAPLALAIANRGFRSVFFDAGGHGESDAAAYGFDIFMDDAANLQRFIGQTPPFAWIGHSAGALALMAARRTHGILASHFVSIAAPYYPYIPIERLRMQVGLPEDVLDHVRRLIAAQFDASWLELEHGSAWARDDRATLMIAYDHDDVIVSPQNGEAIRGLWPDAKLVRTRGCGHNRILRSSIVIEAVAAHLESHA